MVETLRWHCPGSVWAIDHSLPPRAIDGVQPDPGHPRPGQWDATGLDAVPDFKAAEALWCWSAGARHGPPLVFKSDNGSAFISQQFTEWLSAGRSCHALAGADAA